MTGREAAPQNDKEGRVPPNFVAVIPNPPPVIPNGVRNLRAPFDVWLVSPTALDVSRHLRFFVVRSSERQRGGAPQNYKEGERSLE